MKPIDNEVKVEDFSAHSDGEIYQDSYGDYWANIPIINIYDKECHVCICTPAILSNKEGQTRDIEILDLFTEDNHRVDFPIPLGPKEILETRAKLTDIYRIIDYNNLYVNFLFSDYKSDN